MLAAMAMTVIAAPQCLDVSDTTSGWKKVRLTSELPYLAAPGGISQFRSNERVMVVEDQNGLFRAGTAMNGSTEFELDLGRGAQHVLIEFQEPLRGARVDVTSWGVSIVNDSRIRATSFTFSLGNSDASRVWVKVHNHLREHPVLMRVRVERSLLPRELGLPDTFDSPDTLYYFQPLPSQTVRLCNAPGAVLEVSRASIERATKPVSVDRSSR